MAVDRAKYLSLEEVRQLKQASHAAALLDLKEGRTKGPLVWAVVDVALSTGLRVSELAALRCGDFNPRRKSLLVWRKKRRKPIQETIAISPELARHLAEYLEWKRSVNQPTGPEDLLFVGKRGPLTSQGLQLIWRRIVKAAGLPRFSIHAARHTFAVHLLRKTGNLRACQKALGHASPVVTANMYADIAFEDMQDFVTNLYGESA